MQTEKRALAALIMLIAAGAMPLPLAAADLGGDEAQIYEPPVLPPVYTSYFYAGLRGGLTFADSTQYRSGGARITTDYDDPGWMISGYAGYRFQGAPGLRGELELGYLNDAVLSHRVQGLGTFENGAAGDTSVLFGMASLYYDFPTSGVIHPFVGGGIGLADVDLSGHSTAATGALIDDNATAFAWHLTAGASFDLSTNTELELGYRYLATNGAELTASDGTTSTVDTADHIIFAGIKYKF